MNNSFNLIEFVQFVRRNIGVLYTNKIENIIQGDPFTKFTWVPTVNGHSLERIDFTKYRDHVHYMADRRLKAYTLYFERVSQFEEVQSFFKYMNVDLITSAKNLIAIVCALLNNQSVSLEKIAQSIDETFIKRKRSGLQLIWLDGVSVNEPININDEWHIRPIVSNDLTYEYSSYSNSNNSIDRALLRAKSILEIPFSEVIDNNIQRFDNDNVSIYKIISFLRLYNIGGVEEICSSFKLNSYIEDSGIKSTSSTKYPAKTYTIVKSEEISLNSLWKEINIILPPNEPPYELFKNEKSEYKKKLEQKITLNLTDLEVKKIQNKLNLDENKFKSVWISHAIFTRHAFERISAEERVHHITSALETVLVIDPHDTSYKFKTRGAGILNLISSQSGSLIFKILGTLYDVRSKYAHGGRVEKLDSIETSNKFGPIYVRNLILLYYLYIRDRLALNMPEEEKEEILSKNFQVLIEHSLFDKQKRFLLEQFVRKYQMLLMPVPVE